MARAARGRRACFSMWGNIQAPRLRASWFIVGEHALWHGCPATRFTAPAPKGAALPHCEVAYTVTALLAPIPNPGARSVSNAGLFRFSKGNVWTYRILYDTPSGVQGRGSQQGHYGHTVGAVLCSGGCLTASLATVLEPSMSAAPHPRIMTTENVSRCGQMSPG